MSKRPQSPAALSENQQWQTPAAGRPRLPLQGQSIDTVSPRINNSELQLLGVNRQRAIRKFALALFRWWTSPVQSAARVDIVFPAMSGRGGGHRSELLGCHECLVVGYIHRSPPGMLHVEASGSRHLGLVWGLRMQEPRTASWSGGASDLQPWGGTCRMGILVLAKCS